MIRRILSIFMLVSLAGALRATAQESPTVRYGVAFTHGEYSYVALLNTADEWTVTNLGMQLSSLVWSLDGQTIYGISVETIEYPEPGYDSAFQATFGRTIQVFKAPDWRLEKSIEVLPKAILGDRTQGDILSIDSISPDGRYAWVVSTNEIHGSALVDLVNDMVLFQSTCPAIVLDWADTFVITSNQDTTLTFLNQNTVTTTSIPTCDPRVTSIDFATGKGLILGSPSFFVTDGFYSPAADLVVGKADAAHIALFTLDAWGGQEMTGYDPLISADGRYLSYVGLIPLTGELTLLDLQTRQTQALDQGSFYDIEWHDNRLSFVRFTGDNTTTLVVQVQLDETLQRTEVTLYDGPSLPIGGTGYSLGGNSTTGSVQIYLMDELIWDSHEAYPNEQFSFLSLGPLYDNKPIYGRWLWMLGSGGYRILDLETRQLLQQPDEGFVPIGISPDGSWLIGTTIPLPTDDRVPVHYGVAAYNPATSELVTLVERQVASYGMAGYGTPPNSPYSWWSSD